MSDSKRQKIVNRIGYINGSDRKKSLKAYEVNRKKKPDM